MTLTIKLPSVKRPRRLAELVTQLGGLALALTGIAGWSVPAALVVGGVAIVAAVEMQPRG